MAADDLAPHVARSSTAMLLNKKDKQFIVFKMEDFNYLYQFSVEKW